MSDSYSLGTVMGLSGDLQWIDEFGDGSDLVAHEETYSITGALIVQASAKQAGRRLTLQGRRDGNTVFGVLTREQVDALRALAAVPGATYTLTFPDGREFSVMFRRDSAAVEAEPLFHIWPPEPGDLYLPTLKFLQV